MPRYLDLQTWNRREHFYFFKNYEQPFFNICAELEVTPLLQYTKASGLSFFVASLYLSTRTANEIESFRYRLRGERVLVHDVVHAGSTILRDDETFGFCYFDYTPGFRNFHHAALSKLEQAAQQRVLQPHDERDDLLHYSVIPWIAFTGFMHARQSGTKDSVPKIVFGKYHAAGEVIKMPVSVEAHHALMDGRHVGKFFELLQHYLMNPQIALRHES